ncbi:ras guanine nucleotide exchange factor domain-containing protein, partial [Gorgonomyces haynaldii]
FSAISLAAQITAVESNLWTQITPQDFLTHQPPKSVSHTIQQSTHFFNYLTRMIETSILGPTQPETRAMVIHKWLKVARNLKTLRNYQSLKAVLASLSTPPIARLTQTWACVSKNDMALYMDMKELVGESDNYKIYRHLMSVLASTPCVPYIGLFLHDMTFLMALCTKDKKEPRSDARVLQLLQEIEQMLQAPPYPQNMQSLLQKPSLGFRSKKQAIKETFAPEVYGFFKDASDDEIDVFVSHWVLSRPWLTERQIDWLSLEREP